MVDAETFFIFFNTGHLGVPKSIHWYKTFEICDYLVILLGQQL